MYALTSKAIEGCVPLMGCVDAQGLEEPTSGCARLELDDETTIVALSGEALDRLQSRSGKGRSQDGEGCKNGREETHLGRSGLVRGFWLTLEKCKD